MITRTTDLSNSMKLSHAMWGHPMVCHPWQMGHGGEFWQNVVHWRRECKPLQYSCLENPMNSRKKQKRYDPERWLCQDSRCPICYMLGKSGEIQPERMMRLSQRGNDTQLWMCLIVEVQCCTEQYCIGTWNVRSINQGKSEVIKQEMARVNIDILGISKLKRTGNG